MFKSMNNLYLECCRHQRESYSLYMKKIIEITVLGNICFELSYIFECGRVGALINVNSPGCGTWLPTRHK